ncbi:MAG: hypothetical protein PHX61_10255 [Alphaproteobacteria bacterium]|nr:hypothetical protein [Alphaproteobacteria bacterium]
MTNKKYADTKDRLAKIEEIGKQGAEEALSKAKVSDPKLFDGLVSVTQVKAYKKKPKGYSKVSLEAVKLILMCDGLNRTQKSIADELAAKHHEFGITPRIWQRPLPNYEWKAIQTRVRGDLGEKGDVSGCKTLSEVRKRLISINRQVRVENEFNKKIFITKDSVIIGKATYPIESKGAGKYKYSVIRVAVGGKRQAIRLDALEALFAGK